MSLREKLLDWAAVRRLTVKPSTSAYHGELIALLCRVWPNGTASEVETITETDVTHLAEKLYHLSASRWNGIVTLLRSVSPIGARHLRRRRIQIKDRPLLSQLEFSRLLAECDKLKRSRAGIVVRFLAHTGLRINEAKQLRWSDVGECVFMVPGSITKNGRPRAIPFVNGVAEVLKDLRAIRSGQDAGGYVLPRARIRTGLAKACDAAGIARLSHHDFRHLFATRCIQSGADVPTVARWLGHRDGGALLGRIYFHLADEHSCRMAKLVRI